MCVYLKYYTILLPLFTAINEASLKLVVNTRCKRIGEASGIYKNYSDNAAGGVSCDKRTIG